MSQFQVQNQGQSLPPVSPAQGAFQGQLQPQWAPAANNNPNQLLTSQLAMQRLNGGNGEEVVLGGGGGEAKAQGGGGMAAGGGDMAAGGGGMTASNNGGYGRLESSDSVSSDYAVAKAMLLE